VKTFLDAGVLLTAWKGNSPRSVAAKIVLEDGAREFFTSDAVKLELLPKPAFEKRRAEVEFYNAHFSDAEDSEPFSAELGRDALALAKKFGLAAMDALHLASAIRQGADEFITSELPGKPIFRVTGIKVVSLSAL
jgi:predicted nucleic acid-binding protein